ncbi:methyltransferase domain-containing protein [Phytomonospora sp. NPDC050363]|uniref:class I SAM-dependent methyltransferase n=1 Tax=Phytomonospora sp. NPDC050363 TaxID=3155642 RepID=UPI0033CF5C38
MLYQHPLAYLLGIQGIALMRSWGGGRDRAFVQARIDEIRALLDDAERWGEGTEAEEAPAADVYAAWAPNYDDPGNGMIDLEQPVVRRFLDRSEPGLALDAACGTGRHAAYLASRGHRVIGVDTSPAMLEPARAKLPGAEFHQARLEELPLPDAHVDVVVCALALCHVPDLAPVFAEFARVLKPGGRLVVSDVRGIQGLYEEPIVRRAADGRVIYVRNLGRSAADYLTTAIAHGFEVLDCVEPRLPGSHVDEDGVPGNATGPAPEFSPEGPPDRWALHPFAAEATNAAFDGAPVLIAWEFRKR